MPAKPNNTVTDTNPIACRTRTGKKIHRAYSGSSVTWCGVWLRTNASNMQIHLDNTPSCFSPAFCEHCYPNGGTLQNTEIAARHASLGRFEFTGDVRLVDQEGGYAMPGVAIYNFEGRGPEVERDGTGRFARYTGLDEILTEQFGLDAQAGTYRRLKITIEVA